ncbi:MAG: hypothetical protein AAF409_06610 [Pseudomonadota bacterium]
MSRHPLDHSNPEQGARAEEFARIEREHGAEGPHPSTVALQRRTNDSADDGARVKAYTRIERGEQS